MKHARKIIWLAVLLLGLGSSHAHANGLDKLGDAHPYVGVGLSSFTLAAGNIEGLSYSQATSGGAILFAGIKMGIFGAEIRGISTGTFNWQGNVSGFPVTMTASASGTAAFVRLQKKFGELEVYGLIGKTFSDVTVTLQVSGVGTFTGKGNSSSASYGLGVNYGMKYGSGEAAVGLEWMRYYADLTGAALNLSYTF